MIGKLALAVVGGAFLLWLAGTAAAAAGPVGAAVMVVATVAAGARILGS